MWFKEWFHNFPLLPDQASNFAGQVDALFAFVLAVTVFFTVLVAVLVLVFAINYRKEKNPVATQIHGSVPLEVFWTIVPLMIGLFIYAWGAALYFHMFRSPADAMDIYVVGKQWMFKTEHPSGVREINEMHLPVDVNIRITGISQDVMHSIYIPAFRTKHDIVPGRYNSFWFRPTKIGTYHLFCAQYCGTGHSAMVGRVIVMSQADYQEWLSTGNGEGSLASNGQKMFAALGCITCHTGNGGARAPNLAGIYGQPQRLSNGQTVMVDDNYIRESILQPQAKIVEGFQPIMPTFAGQVSEEGLIQLIAYIKSLKPEQQQTYGRAGQTSQTPQDTTGNQPTNGNQPTTGKKP